MVFVARHFVVILLAVTSCRFAGAVREASWILAVAHASWRRRRALSEYLHSAAIFTDFTSNARVGTMAVTVPVVLLAVATAIIGPEKPRFPFPGGVRACGPTFRLVRALFFS